MSGTTSRGFRYPDDTDPVNDGALAVRNLANDVNTKVGAHASGSVNVSVPAGDSSGSGSVIVAFPVGRFTAAPRVVVSSTTFGYVAWVDQITATQCRVLLTHINATPGAITAAVQWIAVQQ
ncbi:hypothetical protein ACJ5H2_05900 [Nocardioides sp. R1-1]|uniref:hypothetical protein n=1 Tax=Nocardioides sp. R1-1 TaxID=3383502 RepID=UPI0038D06ED8